MFQRQQIKWTCRSRTLWMWCPAVAFVPCGQIVQRRCFLICCCARSKSSTANVSKKKKADWAKPPKRGVFNYNKRASRDEGAEEKWFHQNQPYEHLFSKTHQRLVGQSPLVPENLSILAGTKGEKGNPRLRGNRLFSFDAISSFVHSRGLDAVLALE